MKLFSILAFLASIVTWVLAITNWFQHDDHASLGWLFGSIVLMNYAIVAGTMSRRRFYP